MKQLLPIFAFLTILNTNCSEEKNTANQSPPPPETSSPKPALQTGFNISGNMDNGAGATIFLFKYGGDHVQTVDSSIIADDGIFNLSHNHKGYSFYGIGKSVNSVLGLLLKGDEEVKIQLNANNISYGSKVSGSVD